MFVVVVVLLNGYEQLKSLKLLVHKSVLPKDIKMSAAALAYPQYTYLQMQWQGSIPGTS